jgi:HAE1 family hydrophobic/amphiphilic exporter-1
MTTLLMAFFFMMGVLSFMRLPVSDMPNVDFPTITVKAAFPGTNPETMANIVAVPLEKQFMQIPGLQKVTSQNTLGSTQIVLNFDLSRNIDLAAVDVQSAIYQAQAFLPPDLPTPPSYQKVNPSDTPVMYISLMSESIDLAEIYKYSFTLLAQRLSMVDGVAQVLVYGTPYAARIDMDPYLVSTMGLDWPTLANDISLSTPDLPTGQLDGFERSWIVSSKANLQSAAEFAPIIIRWQDGMPVRLEDIGHPIDSLDNIRIGVKYFDKEESKNGTPTVVLAILKQAGANAVLLSELVHKQLPILAKQLPASIKMNIMYDKAVTIKSSIDEVELTLIIAFVLVTLVIFVYLGSPMDTFIPALAMPMSIMMTFWFMDILGYTVDNLSLLALILATGFIVDDAIVVLENIVHHMEAGMGRWKASIEGSKQIGFTIVSMTLSLVAVFIPLVYMQGIIGKLFLEFSIVLIVVILCSGFISLTLTPMLCSRFLALKKEGKKGFAKISETLNTKFNSLYEKSLRKAIHYRKTILLVGVVNVILSFVIGYLLPKDFLPDDDVGFIQGYTLAQEGTSPLEMSNLQDSAANAIKNDPNIRSMISVFGFPQTNQGILYLNLIPYEERTVPNTLQHLQTTLKKVPGINSFLKNIPLINLNIGSISRGQYQYTLSGWNGKDVYSATDLLTEKMKAMPELQAVNNDLQINTPQVAFDILREAASSYGITATDVQNALLYAYSGNRVARIHTPFDQYDVIPEVPINLQRKLPDLKGIWLKNSNTGDMVPMGAIANWDVGVGTSQVNHINQFPSSTIAFNLTPGSSLGPVLEKIEKTAKEIAPSGVYAEVLGAAQTFKDSVSSLGILFIFSIVAIYIILGILYESFIHPLTILSSLPPAILGGLLTLYILGLPLNLYGYLGLILLIGIVKKNGILVVDFALDNKRTKHEDPENSILDACIVRFRPIMMTTFAAIMGAVPIVLASGPGAVGRRSLGYVIIGGLLLSQLITLFLTPVIYLYLDKWNDKFTFKTEKENV